MYALLDMNKDKRFNYVPLLTIVNEYRIWKSLYPDWNPFIRSLDEKAIKDTRLVATLHLKDRKPMIFKPVVTTSDDRKKFVHGEQFTDILARPFHKKLAVPTQEGFMEMNKALKERAEYL